MMMKSKRSPFWDATVRFDEGDIFPDLSGVKGTSLFLGRYSLTEVQAVLEKKSFFKEAKKRNLWPLAWHLDSSEYPVQRFQVFYKEKDPDTLIVDLKIRWNGFAPPSSLKSGAVLAEATFLVLEWLTLQNPLLEFSEKKPALPGQSHPGLNLIKKVMEIFIYLARLTRKEGLLACPAYFHNALLFSRYFKFVNPEKQAEILAIRKKFSTLPFKQLAWIVYLNCLREGERIYEWKAEEQAFPLSRRLREYFDAKTYRENVRQAASDRRFSVDWDRFKDKIQSIPFP